MCVSVRTIVGPMCHVIQTLRHVHHFQPYSLRLQTAQPQKYVMLGINAILINVFDRRPHRIEPITDNRRGNSGCNMRWRIVQRNSDSTNVWFSARRAPEHGATQTHTHTLHPNHQRPRANVINMSKQPSLRLRRTSSIPLLFLPILHTTPDQLPRRRQSRPCRQRRIRSVPSLRSEGGGAPPTGVDRRWRWSFQLQLHRSRFARNECE